MTTVNYNREKIEEAFQQGDRLKFLFFWGHQPSRSGEITSSCFSQWWVSPFEVEGNIYRTAEHWMMAEKARLFHDEEILSKILACSTPAEAKKLGRLVKNFDQQVWEKERSGIVVKGNYQKFKQHPELMEYLINTKQRILVEASPRDRIWGIGMGAQNEHASVPTQWRGLNLLGFALMEVRDIIKKD